jgi:transcriptional regulator with XRE-family HTH domain
VSAPDDKGGSTLPRRQLGRRLRRLRERAGVTQSDAAGYGELSISTLTRIESGKSPCKALVARALATRYGADEHTVTALEELARETKTQAWWTPFNQLIPESLLPRFGLEAAASELHWYELAVVPSLLQTPDYAGALISHAFPDAVEDEIMERVKLRLQRQLILTRPVGAPSLQVVLDESVVRRTIGGAVVAAAQRDHLLRMMQLYSVDIRIQRFGSGVHQGLESGPFVLLDFPVDDSGTGESVEPSTVYVEVYYGGLFFDKRSETDRFRAAFQRIWNTAEPLTPAMVKEWNDADGR